MNLRFHLRPDRRKPARVRPTGRPITGRVVAALLASGVLADPAEIPKAPVPASPFLPVIYRYADAIVDRGRDTYGPQKTGLFLSALDRSALAPLTNRPPAPRGISEQDRAGANGGALTGANLHHDENLLRLLFTLSELSGRPKYSNAAATALTFFFNHSSSTGAPLGLWGPRRAWDVLNDQPIVPDAPPFREGAFFRPWMLWDRCFDLAPLPSRQFALALWSSQTNGARAGARVISGGADDTASRFEMNRPRQAGFCIRTWARAYARTREGTFLGALEGVLSQLERARQSNTDWMVNNPADNLSLAIDCDGSAHDVPDALAKRLRAFAAGEDEHFCSRPHRLRDTRGFITAVGRPALGYTPLWRARADGFTTAQVALMGVSRYENTGRVAYRELIHAAADAYLAASVEEEPDLWPGPLGHVISLQVAAWRSTAQAKYLERGRELGRFALEKFFDQSPLPRASLKSNHYETITGADTLALALVELHLHVLHITAVRCPPNTIDR